MKRHTRLLLFMGLLFLTIGGGQFVAAESYNGDATVGFYGEYIPIEKNPGSDGAVNPDWTPPPEPPPSGFVSSPYVQGALPQTGSTVKNALFRSFAGILLIAIAWTIVRRKGSLRAREVIL